MTSRITLEVIADLGLVSDRYPFIQGKGISTADYRVIQVTAESYERAKQVDSRLVVQRAKEPVVMVHSEIPVPSGVRQFKIRPYKKSGHFSLHLMVSTPSPQQLLVTLREEELRLEIALNEKRVQRLQLEKQILESQL